MGKNNGNPRSGVPEISVLPSSAFISLWKRLLVALPVFSCLCVCVCVCGIVLVSLTLGDMGWCVI